MSRGLRLRDQTPVSADLQHPPTCSIRRLTARISGAGHQCGGCLAGHAGGPVSLGGVFERFADDAHRAVVVAQDECRRRGHAKIRSAHLALGALAAGDPLPGGPELAVRLAEVLGSGTAPDGALVDPDEGLPFAGSARRVVAAAGRRAEAEHRPLVDRYDVLLAALDEPAVAEPAAEVTDVDALREAAVSARQATAPGGDALVVALLRQVLARLDALESRLDERHR